MKDEADRIDEALAAWPANARTTEADWDAAAQRVVDHVDSGVRAKSATLLAGGVNDEDLLAPPLPETSDERSQISSRDVAISKVAAITSPSSTGRPESGRGRSASQNSRRDGMSTQTERQRDRSSFKELAALAAIPPPASAGSVAPASGPVSGPPSSRKIAPRSEPQPSVDPDDSGLVDLHMSAASDPQASERALTTPLASVGLLAHEPPGTENVASSRPNAQPKPEEKGQKTRTGVVLFLGGLVVLAAAAAGGMVFVRTGAPSRVFPPVGEHAAPVALRVEPAVPAARAIPVPDTAPEMTEKVAPKALVAASKAGGGEKRAAAKPSAKEPVAKEARTEPQVAAPEKPPAAAPAGDLGAAMQKEVGPQDKATPASQPTGPAPSDGTVPQKPSQGQVAGAIGAVLQSARACLGPDDPVSKALVVFGSSGAVSSVTVSGHAAGTPAEACIKTAFGKAKVSPFAETRYAANVTVRPL